MNSFCFVILNYVTTDDTIDCVKSIKKYCDGFNYNIVIVDNASPNNSGNTLLEMYKNDHSIKVVISEENKGFARGNNIGFEIAKNEYKADFIVLCNSDTQILNSNFCSLVIEEYNKSSFAVLGPKERLIDGSYYPLQKKIRGRLSLKLKINYYKSLLDSRKVSNFYRVMNKLYDLLTRGKKLNVEKKYNDIVLHGAFLIFSGNYINRFDGLSPVTFFYGEEEILALRLKKYNLHSVYNPNIEILHKRKSATKASKKSEKQRELFRTTCLLDSVEKVLGVIDGNIQV